MAGGSGHILLVEDHSDTRRLIGDQLVRLGYNVTRVSTLNECVQSLQGSVQPLDLVLMDRFLPDGDGCELVGRIQMGRELPKVPVVIISVDRSAEGVAQALSAGAVDYLVKPFESKVLAARVAVAIREARRKETLIRTQQVLARIKRELELIFDSVSESILLIDSEMVVRRCNSQAVSMLGKVSYDQVVGRKCHEIFCDSSSRCADCPALEAFNNRASAEREGECEINGRKVLHQRRAKFIDRADGGGEMVLLVVHDVTAQRTSEQEKVRADRLETVMRLAGGLAHEISQPLAAVSGRSELLEMLLDGQEMPDYQEIRRHVGNLRENTRRLSAIVKRLQNVSEYITKPYYGQTEIIDLERSSSGSNDPRD